MAGGARQEEADPCKYALLGNLLTAADTPPVDILALQEVIRVEDPSNEQVVRDDIALLKEQSGLGSYDHFFFPYLDSRHHPHPRKWESKIFKEWYQKEYHISEGTAILLKDGHFFWDLLRNDRRGSASGQVIPWYTETPTFYLGNRDTSPRTLLMARVRLQGRFVLFCCVHLATLKAEDSKAQDGKDVRIPRPQAITIRTRQIEWILSYLESYQAARRDLCNKEKQEYREEPIVLAGDFNADPDASELSRLRSDLGLEVAGITAGPTYTHRKHKILMDLVFAPKDTIESARVLDLAQLEVSSERRISDHHPVAATLDL